MYKRQLTSSSCATPDCSVANLLWLGVYRPGESNTRELWDSCMDGGEAYVSYWISESRPLRRPPRGLPAHCSLLLGGQPWTIRTRIGDQWIIDSGDDDDAATPIEAALGSPGGMLDAHCDLLASDDAWPTTKPRSGHKYPCACTSPRPGDESHLGDDSYDEILHHDAAVLAGQFDHAVDRLRADQQATAGIMFGVAIAIWIVLSIVLGATDPNVRRALRQVCGGGKKAPAKLTTQGGGQSMSQEEIEAILAASLDAAAFVRVRVGFALRAVGLLLLTIGFAPLLTHVATSGFLTAVVGPYGFWGMFRFIGLTLFCMSVVPSDACGVRALQIFALIGFIVTTLVWVILIAEELADPMAEDISWLRNLAYVIGVVGSFVCVVLQGRTLRSKPPPGEEETPCCTIVKAPPGQMVGGNLRRKAPRHTVQDDCKPALLPRQALRETWRAARIFFAITAAVMLLSLISEAIYDYTCEVCNTDHPKFAYFGQYASPAALILCIAFTTPANRRRVVRCLGSGRVTSNGQQREYEQLSAAAVAALSGVGATSVSTLLTFLQTGGNPEDIEHEEDRERLLAAIESSYGDVSYFNKITRRELQLRTSLAAERRSSSTGRTSSRGEDVVVTIAEEGVPAGAPATQQMGRAARDEAGEEGDELSARHLAGCWLNFCTIPPICICYSYLVWAKDDGTDDTIQLLACGPVAGLPMVSGEYRRGVEVEAGTGRRVKSSRYKKTDGNCMMAEEYFDVKDRSTMRSNLSLCNHFRIC